MIENANLPQPLPGGSLLFARTNAARQPQLHRFRPGTGRLAALPAVLSAGASVRKLIRLLRDGRMVLMGKPFSGGAGGDALSALSLDSGRLRRLGPDVPTDDVRSLAVRPDDGAVLVALREGSTYRVLQLTPDSMSEPQPLLTLLSPSDLEAGPDRALQVSLMDRPVEILRFREAGRGVERITVGPDLVGGGDPISDGRVLYVAADGSISGVPLDGGSPRAICPGDSLTVDPDTGDLIVKVEELERIRLVRVSPNDGSPRPIAIHGDLRLVNEPLVPGAVRNGRLLRVATADSWYWYAGVLDMKTGRLEKIALDYFTDFHGVTWAADGSVVGYVLGMQSALWRFAPVERP